MAQIDAFLKLAVQQNASDIHFSSHEAVRLRVDGELMAIENSAQDPDELQAMLLEVLSDLERHRFIKNKNLDKSYTAEGIGNFRMNVFLSRKGIAAVLRSIPSEIPTMKDLSLPSYFEKLIGLEKGLILVTGPTGVGKSTTLASMIHEINKKQRSHILTIEDPIEFIHKSNKSLVNQREIGSSCDSFADALKYALREDPDVILIGEMRDLETIELAMTAAETGHLVFGTLHTRGAAASIDRIINSFPAEKQAMVRMVLSDSLQAVISQTLLKRADGKGRVAAFEVLTVNHAVSNLIREGKTFQIPSAIQTARKEGMILMDQYILELVKQGFVTREEAVVYLENPALLGGPQTPAKSLLREEPALNEPKLKMPPPSPQVAKAVPPPPPKASVPPPQSTFKPLEEEEVLQVGANDELEGEFKEDDISGTLVNRTLAQLEAEMKNKKPLTPPPFPKKKSA